jgi:hypothetical protein
LNRPEAAVLQGIAISLVTGLVFADTGYLQTPANPSQPEEIRMLLDTFESQGLLFNSNFKDSAGSGLQAYRGDLVLIEGEVADAMGRRKPPLATMIGAVLLADESKLKFVAGSLDEITHLGAFVDKFAPHFAPDMATLLFVVNIAKPMRVELAGIGFILLPLFDGMVWNELVDELNLDKSDFKGQSSGEKVMKLYKAYQDYRPRCETVSFADSLIQATNAKRGFHGAV